ncbi:Mhp366/Mhp367 family surface (lipo)protein [Mycoplasma sp. 'Moose RK']|uniref:Mhp366/Mhp367 family surface (lipo)protein n=1 Tax=Mycoplasma sp. 'Moose RK' TaxID=2780095 RepID=UPI0018C21D47|nr:hypothetical protein [Mycoplasma sp. 'Moose RK']MBG0730882.1 hypothetical protein [Mycoplasma sp. 'Moose RK']
MKIRKLAKFSASFAIAFLPVLLFSCGYFSAIIPKSTKIISNLEQENEKINQPKQEIKKEIKPENTEIISSPKAKNQQFSPNFSGQGEKNDKLILPDLSIPTEKSAKPMVSVEPKAAVEIKKTEEKIKDKSPEKPIEKKKEEIIKPVEKPTPPVPVIPVLPTKPAKRIIFPPKEKESLKPENIDKKILILPKNEQKPSIFDNQSENRTKKIIKTQGKPINLQANLPSNLNKVDPNIFDETKFLAINRNSINSFNPSKLSDVVETKVQDINFKWDKLKNLYQNFIINAKNGIKQENDKMFLGQKNEGLNIYLLDKLNANQISYQNPARFLYNSYYNPRFSNKHYKLKYFGFKSLDYSDQRYRITFQRNVRFSVGTAVLLDSYNGESVFLTNRHVLYVGGEPFWKKSAFPFMRFYYNNKANTVYPLGYSGILSLLWIKNEYEKKIAEIKKKNIYNVKTQIRISNPDIKTMQKFSQDFYSKFFRLAKDFNNHNKDLGIFYFNEQKFTKEIEDLLAFYKQNQKWFMRSFRLSSGETFDDLIKKFTDQFNVFKEFWQEMAKLPPLEINDRVWKEGEIDYTTKLGSFWPNMVFAKNIFKGVVIRNGEPMFFATNGPGASGSGIFDANGKLVFLNQLIMLDKNQKNFYYDQNNLTSHVTSGILFRTKYLNLVDEIKKFYYNKKVKEVKTTEKTASSDVKSKIEESKKQTKDQVAIIIEKLESKIKSIENMLKFKNFPNSSSTQIQSK